MRKLEKVWIWRALYSAGRGADVRLALSLAALALSAAEPGYVDPRTCQSCHAAIFESYIQTGMGKSFAKAANVPALQAFRHTGSGRSYSIVQRNGSAYLRREPGPVEKRIDYAIGSGNHSKTFVSTDDSGRLFELPVSWYAESGGSWHMSPGYDRPDHSDFRREIPDSCLFCHNGYPSASNRGLASGIDCQRCHGPGEAHVTKGGPILNPAKQNRQRQLEVCLQCHLESASRTLPEAVRTPGRGIFSYRAGEPLEDYMTFFEYRQADAAGMRITVNGAGYGLLKSACYRGSAGKLLCTTCHDPHRRQDAATANVHFTRVCRSCHAPAHKASADKRFTQGCADCHMPKRRTEDAVHVIMTDHRIRRGPLPGDPVEPLQERHDRISGPVQPLYPAVLPRGPVQSLVQAMAEAVPETLALAIARAQPRAAEPFSALGAAWAARGRTEDAIRAYRKAAEFSGQDSGPFIQAADLLVKSGRAPAAIELLLSANRRVPDDPALLNSLAVAHVAESHYSQALEFLDRANRLRPEDPMTHLNRGVCLEALGDTAGAMAAYRRALLYQPDLRRAREFLDRLAAAN